VVSVSIADLATFENGIELKNADPGTQFSIDIALGRKRKLDSVTGDESDDDATQAPPPNDIYRQRQQKKVVKI